MYRSNLRTLVRLLASLLSDVKPEREPFKVIAHAAGEDLKGRKRSFLILEHESGGTTLECVSRRKVLKYPVGSHYHL